MATSTPDEPIWRYMNLEKFISLLRTQSLWFARCDTFEDRWEGFSRALPISMSSLLASNGEGLYPQRHATVTDYQQLVLAHDKWLRNSMNKAVFVSCWTMGPSESVPMWKIFCSYDSGIAIRSSTRRFEQHVDMYPPFVVHRIGPVRYLKHIPFPDFDYSENVHLSWDLACDIHFRKRSCFAYEKEWRAVGVGKARHRNKGISVDIDLNGLIDRVVVSPMATPSFLRTVQAVAQQFGLTTKPQRSALTNRLPRRSAPIKK